MAFWNGFYGTDKKKIRGKDLIKVGRTSTGNGATKPLDSNYDKDYDDNYEDETTLKAKISELEKEILVAAREISRQRELSQQNTEFLQKIILELINRKPEPNVAPKVTVADYLAQKKAEGVKRLP